jgi:NAD(P)-dependent dehydrogenase (short-subunit alcohol dehydrogenase family)
VTARLEGRAAIVSGAASGIGRAVARRMRTEGADVALIDLRADALGEVAAELGGHAVPCDVSDTAAVARAVAACRERLGRPADVLVNAAGIYRVQPLLELEPDAWDEVQRINARGTLACAREFAGALIAVGRPGAIVNLSSIAGLVASAGEPAGHYAASKAAVIALTRQMAVEWSRHGIRANAVCPGVIDTPMLRLTDDPEAAAAYLDARVPLHRLGTAEEVAAVICFLASDDAAYVTGCALPVDGGITAL